MKIDKFFKNYSLNLISGMFPFLLFVILTPKTLKMFGLELFGIYSILCSILIILGGIDFGVSRTVVLVVADKGNLELRNDFQIFKIGKNLIHFISAIYVVLGSTVIFLFISDFRALTDVTAAAIMTLLSSIATLQTSTHRSILEVNDRFLSLNLVRTVLACFVPLAPLLPVFSVNYPLSSALLWVAASRCAGLIVYHATTSKYMRPLKGASTGHIKKSSIIKFVNRSKYVGITNILSLIMVYADRFLIASFLSIVAMANYVIAYETVTKVWLVMGAISSAMLPQLAAENRTNKSNLNDKSIVYKIRIVIFSACIAPCIFISSFGTVIFELWLGDAYNAEISRAAMILAFGVALNCMTQLNFNILQIHGGERYGLVLQVLNIACWSILCLAIVPIYGLEGAAVAFLARMILDAALVAHACKINNVFNIGFRWRDYLSVIALFFISNLERNNLYL
jgi:O-antigen/teichoic acid export membrane protein